MNSALGTGRMHSTAMTIQRALRVVETRMRRSMRTGVPMKLTHVDDPDDARCLANLGAAMSVPLVAGWADFL